MSASTDFGTLQMRDMHSDRRRLELVAERILRKLPLLIQFSERPQHSRENDKFRYLGILFGCRVESCIDGGTFGFHLSYAISFPDPFSFNETGSVNWIRMADRVPKIFSASAFASTCAFQWDMDERYGKLNPCTKKFWECLQFVTLSSYEEEKDCHGPVIKSVTPFLDAIPLNIQKGIHRREVLEWLQSGQHLPEARRLKPGETLRPDDQFFQLGRHCNPRAFSIDVENRDALFQSRDGEKYIPREIKPIDSTLKFDTVVVGASPLQQFSSITNIQFGRRNKKRIGDQPSHSKQPSRKRIASMSTMQQCAVPLPQLSQLLQLPSPPLPPPLLQPPCPKTKIRRTKDVTTKEAIKEVTTKDTTSTKSPRAKRDALHVEPSRHAKPSQHQSRHQSAIGTQVSEAMILEAKSIQMEIIAQELKESTPTKESTPIGTPSPTSPTAVGLGEIQLPQYQPLLGPMEDQSLGIPPLEFSDQQCLPQAPMFEMPINIFDHCSTSQLKDSPGLHQPTTPSLSIQPTGNNGGKRPSIGEPPIKVHKLVKRDQIQIIPSSEVESLKLASTSKQEFQFANTRCYSGLPICCNPDVPVQMKIDEGMHPSSTCCRLLTCATCVELHEDDWVVSHSGSCFGSWLAKKPCGKYVKK